MLKKNFYTAVPYDDINLCFQLRTAYQNRITSSMVLILEAISDSQDVDLSRLINKVKGLDLSRRYSSALHFVSASLEGAYSNKDAAKLHSALTALANLQDKDMYSENFSLGTVYEDFYDHCLEGILRTQDDVSNEYKAHPEINKLERSDLIEFFPFAKQALDKIREAALVFIMK